MVSPEQQWHQQVDQAQPVGKKPKITRLSIICISFLVLVIGGIGTYVELTDADVGDCVAARPSGKKVKFDKADCAAPEAVYLMAAEDRAHDPDCPHGPYVMVYDSGRRKSKTDTITCYALNVKEGDCLKKHKYGNETVHDRVPCAGAEQKVAKVVNGKADESLCEDRSLSLAYAQPAKTICMVKP